MASPSDAEIRFRPSAAVMAWLWPGLGHITLGERERGLLIMLGVLFLFFTGLLVGGLDCVDRKNDRLWFLAQGLCGPIAFAADLANQSFIQPVPGASQAGGNRSLTVSDWRASTEPELRSRYETGDPELHAALQRIGLGRVNEMGTLFIALAGLMNLVVILDAMYARANGGSAARHGESPLVTATDALLAYIPFVTPINAFHEWSFVLIVPLALGISVIYKALRMSRLDGFWKQVTIMTTQIVVALVGLGIALTVLVQLVVPLLPVR